MFVERSTYTERNRKQKNDEERCCGWWVLSNCYFFNRIKKIRENGRVC